jgi:hypothetical protein
LFRQLFGTHREDTNNGEIPFFIFKRIIRLGSLYFLDFKIFLFQYKTPIKPSLFPESDTILPFLPQRLQDIEEKSLKTVIFVT